MSSYTYSSYGNKKYTGKTPANNGVTYGPRTSSAGYKKKIYKKSYVKKPNLAALVKAMILKQEEKKMSVFYDANPVPIGGWASALATGAQIPITPFPTTGPSIVQGTGESDRIGNKIRTYKVELKLNLFPYSYGSPNNPVPIPQDIRIIISAQKNNHTIAPLAANMLDTGNGFSGFTGTVDDLILPLNKDTQVVYVDRIVKLGYSIYGGTGSQAGSQSFSNNDYKLNQMLKFDCTKYCPAVVDYNDTTTTPTSKSVWVTIVPCNADGSNSTNNYTCYYSHVLTYSYTDA